MVHELLQQTLFDSHFFFSCLCFCKFIYTYICIIGIYKGLIYFIIFLITLNSQEIGTVSQRQPLYFTLEFEDITCFVYDSMLYLLGGFAFFCSFYKQEVIIVQSAGMFLKFCKTGSNHFLVSSHMFHMHNIVMQLNYIMVLCKSIYLVFVFEYIQVSELLSNSLPRNNSNMIVFDLYSFKTNPPKIERCKSVLLL